ncbi:glycosyltransferase family 2 protein [Delftia sp. RIT313]|uniref:glycosyltransferase family 2 protein n=1 Tax=Delftia sp. RIT313 TaxID=1468410 RepID=UPI00044BB048|nr:glycosyltransferase family 2 protein [Delftia sp. RIT313]EZP54002.1 Glycosyl transferase family 2 [Delftia sp. RIT313]
MKYTVVIPVYKNEASIPRLLEVLSDMGHQLGRQMEVVFVVDGSPDQSFAMLKASLHQLDFPAQLLLHSRNFGSFPAIRSGLAVARGEYFGVMAADLQEPPELLIAFFVALANEEYDVVIGTRESRNDPYFSRIASGIFWSLYRKMVVPDMPEGGVDVFGCNRAFRDQLLKLEESRSSLIALIFWLGFRRKLVSYERLIRQEGKSSWTLKKKIDYMMDSIFAFTDYPIRLLIRIGVLGCIMSMALGAGVFIAHVSGRINVPGYAATMLVVLFFGMLNLLGLGLVGTYAWRAYENSKQRPLAVVALNISNSREGALSW